MHRPVQARLLQLVPDGIPVWRADATTASKVILEVRNQYFVRFESAAPSASVEVVVKQPRGLPSLKLHY